MMKGRLFASVVAGVLLVLLLVAAVAAPEHLGNKIPELRWASPGEIPPFGADDGGRSLLDYATQGARVVALPSIVAGLLVAGAVLPPPLALPSANDTRLVAVLGAPEPGAAPIDAAGVQTTAAAGASSPT